MRHGVESQGRLKQLSIELQELARVCRACIGDDKADVEVIRCRHQLFKKAVVREVDHDRAILNAKVFCDSTPNFFQSVKPPGTKHNVKRLVRSVQCRGHTRVLVATASIAVQTTKIVNKAGLMTPHQNQ